jgi:hypothetical protein
MTTKITTLGNDYQIAKHNTRLSAGYASRNIAQTSDNSLLGNGRRDYLISHATYYPANAKYERLNMIVSFCLFLFVSAQLGLILGSLTSNAYNTPSFQGVSSFKNVHFFDS